MKTTPNINPESQDVAELQAMVKALMAEKASLLEQFKLAIDRQFANALSLSNLMMKRREICSMKPKVK
ncbi:hypothetical protein VCRA2119O147_2880004 [Vibrio crassostreae]|nr:hypothetical protein VCRA2119O145_190004 [Vibrio crassostreae]CAK1812022.1 hypothetical protein VCRA2118O144_190004 [Vibrio crassostreae]CAK2299901.1 hypothetical protein VCRA2117O143_190004 [Vibrio crassostreae]CAK2315680.1 hypothetical protein VCRA2117O142_220004 [Vibrio crassostreae]CAK2328503.1 hypothetical protein VCRA2119O147_2880004 [Vibrio crassostreae]